MNINKLLKLANNFFKLAIDSEKEEWKLWLDDQINDLEAPARHIPEDYLGAASTQDAQALVEENGPPAFMDLDHDLGEDDSAMVFLKWLSDNYFEYPPEWAVHSANPVGRDNINSYMNSWHKVIKMD